MSADQEFAEQLDKEMNAIPQMRSTPHKKATPQKKYYKTSRFETTGVEPHHEARGVEQ